MTDSPSSSGPQPPAPGRQRRLIPPDPPMVPLAVAGTAIWLVLGLVLTVLRPTLARGGNEGWISICFWGAGLGVVGIAIMALHDRNRRRRTDGHDAGHG